MARFTFGGTSADVALSKYPNGGRIYLTAPVGASGDPVGVTLTFWDAEVGGNQITDLLVDGAATTSITIPAGDLQVPAFEGPDEVTEMWADDGDAHRALIASRQGPRGPQGPQGPKGDTGATGPQGPQGPTGPQGEAGPVGPSGLNWRGAWSATADYVADDAVGYDGASWFANIDPPVGDVPSGASTYWQLLAAEGAQGPQGIKGPQGIEGPVGPEGPANNLAIGTVVGGDVADASISGVSPSQTLNLTLPKGDTGSIGPVGPQGPKGDTGSIGPQGPVGDTGPAGPGVAAGGATGQALVKASGTDYDTRWVTTARVLTVTEGSAVPGGTPDGTLFVEYTP